MGARCHRGWLNRRQMAAVLLRRALQNDEWWSSSTEEELNGVKERLLQSYLNLPKEIALSVQDMIRICAEKSCDTWDDLWSTLRFDLTQCYENHTLTGPLTLLATLAASSKVKVAGDLLSNVQEALLHMARGMKQFNFVRQANVSTMAPHWRRHCLEIYRSAVSCILNHIAAESGRVSEHGDLFAAGRATMSAFDEVRGPRTGSEAVREEEGFTFEGFDPEGQTTEGFSLEVLGEGLTGTSSQWLKFVYEHVEPSCVQWTGIFDEVMEEILLAPMDLESVKSGIAVLDCYLTLVQSAILRSKSYLFDSIERALEQGKAILSDYYAIYDNMVINDCDNSAITYLETEEGGPGVFIVRVCQLLRETRLKKIRPHFKETELLSVLALFAQLSPAEVQDALTDPCSFLHENPGGSSTSTSRLKEKVKEAPLSPDELESFREDDEVAGDEFSQALSDEECLDDSLKSGTSCLSSSSSDSSEWTFETQLIRPALAAVIKVTSESVLESAASILSMAAQSRKNRSFCYWKQMEVAFWLLSRAKLNAKSDLSGSVMRMLGSVLAAKTEHPVLNARAFATVAALALWIQNHHGEDLPTIVQLAAQQTGPPLFTPRGPSPRNWHDGEQAASPPTLLRLSALHCWCSFNVEFQNTAAYPFNLIAEVRGLISSHSSRSTLDSILTSLLQLNWRRAHADLQEELTLFLFHVALPTVSEAAVESGSNETARLISLLLKKVPDTSIFTPWIQTQLTNPRREDRITIALQILNGLNCGRELNRVASLLALLTTRQEVWDQLTLQALFEALAKLLAQDGAALNPSQKAKLLSYLAANRESLAAETVSRLVLALGVDSLDVPALLALQEWLLSRRGQGGLIVAAGCQCFLGVRAFADDPAPPALRDAIVRVLGHLTKLSPEAPNYRCVLYRAASIILLDDEDPDLLRCLMLSLNKERARPGHKTKCQEILKAVLLKAATTFKLDQIVVTRIQALTTD